MNCRLCNKELNGAKNQRYCCRQHLLIDENRYVGETVVEYFARKRKREQMNRKSSYPPVVLRENVL